MKKIVLFALVTTVALARVESDVALTWGHNSFDDDQVLYGSAAFYGVRAGTMIDDTYGAQVGYEQTNSANCQGLSLKRYYVNGVLQKKLSNGLRPYALATLGYETSSKEYRPDQTFMGLGGGLKYRFSNNTDVFLETRALKSMDSKDVTWATTLGLGYAFTTAPIIQKEQHIQKALPQAPQSKPVAMAPVQIVKERTKVETGRFIPASTKRVTSKQSVRKDGVQHGYFVQIAALNSSSTQPYMKKLQRGGFHNARVKHVAGRKLVVVGPYRNRVGATKALKKLKRISKGAFIKRF
jgi:cell division septation protein DedD